MAGFLKNYSKAFERNSKDSTPPSGYKRSIRRSSSRTSAPTTSRSLRLSRPLLPGLRPVVQLRPRADVAGTSVRRHGRVRRDDGQPRAARSTTSRPLRKLDADDVSGAGTRTTQARCRASTGATGSSTTTSSRTSTARRCSSGRRSWTARGRRAPGGLLDRPELRGLPACSGRPGRTTTTRRRRRWPGGAGHNPHGRDAFPGAESRSSSSPPA